MVMWVLVEAQLLHVSLYGEAVVVLAAVTLAHCQFSGFFLTAQYRYGVVTSERALFAVEHGAAIAIVIFEGLGAQRVRCTNPLGHSTRHYGFTYGFHHLGPADFGAELLILAVLVAAVALEVQEKTYNLHYFQQEVAMQAVHHQS